MGATAVTCSGRSSHAPHALPVACAAVTVATDPIYAGLARQAELIAAGELSSRELTETYLERIARLDPTLNAFRIVFAERALIEADQADGRRRGGDERPLLGVPVAIKDDTDVAGEITAHGTQRLRRARARGRRGGPPPARRRRRDHRQDQRPGAGDRPVHGDADLRRHPQPVGPQPHARRVERRLGRRGRGRPGRRRARLRRRRLDPHPRRLLRPLRPQAPARPHPDGADAGAVARPLGLRRGHPPRRRHRALPRRHRRRRAARSRRRPRPRASSGSRTSTSRHAADPRLAGRASSSGALDDMRELLRGLGHDVGERRDPATAPPASRSPPATSRGVADRGRASCRIPSASRAAPRASAASAARSRRAALAARARRRRPPTRARSPPSSSTPTS